jgi:AbiU2
MSGLASANLSDARIIPSVLIPYLGASISSPSPYRTAEEVAQDHLGTLGPQLGPVYNALSNEVISLHGKWNQYRQLYATSEERIELLNRSAGYFFWLLQETLIEDVLLHLARLTDLADHGRGRTNLTLRQLPDLISDLVLKKDVTELVERAVGSTAAACDWRNRRLAHRDLALALGPAGAHLATSRGPLQGVSRVDIGAALAAFRTILNRIEGHFWIGSQVGYEFFEGGRGDADSLVRCLQRGQKSYESRERRFEQGNPLPEDLQPEPEI